MCDAGYALVDMNILFRIIAKSWACTLCGGEMKLQENADERVGVVSIYMLNCLVCGASQKFHTSDKAASGVYEANLRMVYALRCIGKGAAAGSVLCAMLNLPKPPTKFSKYNEELLVHTEAATEDSMQRAMEEAVQLNDNDKDIDVALDGSWQKREPTSNNGIISATSVDSGKVLDVAVMAKHCRVCSSKDGCSDPQHENICQRNYQGTSGGMEVSGALQIFKRSEKRCGVRYIKYLGDGDCKAFMAVKEAKPYGESIEVTKLECIGHVQKRMGTRWKRLKKED